MDEYDPSSLSVDEALARIKKNLKIVPGEESVSLRSALGRILAESIQSPIDVPNHTNSAMDGFAVRVADLSERDFVELDVIGTALAGSPFAGQLRAGQCIRITTGAAVPAGADTVVIQERVERQGDKIRLKGKLELGENIRAAGEDIAIGEAVLEAGHRLLPADLGLLASLGLAEIRVHRQLRVAFFSTGDELRQVGEALQPGSIYDSNRYTLYGMLNRLGVQIIDMGVVRDEPEALLKALRDASDSADVVITSGGVSVGDADHVREALSVAGKIEFWKVAMKPGRPLAFGRIGDAAFFGLPGNPVSVMVTFYVFVQSALQHMMGTKPRPPRMLQACCESRLKKKAGRTEYQRGVLRVDTQGRLFVRRTGAQGSGILTSMSQANCFVVLPTAAHTINENDMVTVLPFSEII